MKAHCTVELMPTVRIEKPFLWASDSGCVYLRNVDSDDIIVGPRICDEKLGKVTESCTSDEAAWIRRLRPGGSVKLENK